MSKKNSITDKICNLPTVLILTLFILTDFIYKDFDIRMLYGYAILGGIALFVFCFRAKIYIKSRPWSQFEAIYAVMVVAIIINIFRKDVNRTYDLISYLIAVVISFVYVLISQIKKDELNKAIKVIIVIAGLFALWLILNLAFPEFKNHYFKFLSKESQKYNTWVVKEYFVSIGGSLTYVEYIMMLGISAAVARYSMTQKKIWFLAVCIYTFIAFLMGRRGEFLAIIITLVLLKGVSFKKGTGKRGKYFFVIIATGLFALFLFIKCIPYFTDHDLLTRYIETYNHIKEGKDFTSGRKTLYQLAISTFKEHPLGGIGWGNYGTLIPDGWFYRELGDKVHNVHNIYLELLCENGIIGGGIIIGCLMTLYVKTIKLANRIFSLMDEKLKNIEYHNALAMIIMSFVIQTFFLITGLLDPVFSKRIFWMIYALAIIFASNAYRMVNNIKESNLKYEGK